MKNMFKKADFVLLAILILIGIALSAVSVLSASRGAKAVVTVDGEIYGTYSLSDDQEITVERDGHTNKITIKDGNAQMTFANCHNQDCVKQGKINDMSKSIICLPHKVVVEIQSDDRKYDAVSG